MLLAAKTLAATAFDLFHEPQTLAEARRELERSVGTNPYVPMLEPGQAPPLDYRNPHRSSRSGSGALPIDRQRPASRVAVPVAGGGSSSSSIASSPSTTR